MSEQPSTYFVDLHHLDDDRASFAHERHGTTASMSRADWDKSGRPMRLTVSTGQVAP